MAYALISQNGIFCHSCESPSTYMGVDLNPWAEVDDIIFSGSVDLELLRLRNISTVHYSLSFSQGTLDKLNDALYVKSKCNYSQIVEFEILGGNQSGIGIDLYCDGYSSLLKMGIGQNPDAFKEFNNNITPFGLLSSADKIEKYISFYKNITEKENLEPIAEGVEIMPYMIIRLL